MTKRRATATAAIEPVEDPEPSVGLDLGPLPGFVGYMLRRAQLLIFDDFIRTMSSVGLRPASFSVLAVIAANPGSTQSAVSNALGLQRTNLVAIIDSLEQGGFARREPAKTDRRSHALHLTDQGQRLLARALKLQAEHERRILQKLGPGDSQSLLHLLTRLVDG
jgi:DNA-binding MarR family transcriptional regulator